MDQKKAKKDTKEAVTQEATIEKERRFEETENAKNKSSRWRFWQ